MKNDELTAERLLATPAAFDHELRVRSIGPAIVIVLERDAPLRFEVLTSTEGENGALREYVEGSPRAAHVWAAFRSAKEHEEGVQDPGDWSLADEHEKRLAAASPIASDRVTT